MEQQEMLSTADEKSNFALKLKMQIPYYQLFYFWKCTLENLCIGGWEDMYTNDHTGTRKLETIPMFIGKRNEVHFYSGILSDSETNELDLYTDM